MQNILKHYKDILDDIGFKIEKSVIEEPEFGRLLVRGRYQGDPALIKIYNFNQAREKRLKKEKIVDEIINNYNKNNQQKIEKVDVLSLDSNGDFIWLIRKYYLGESLANPVGQLSDLNVLLNHDLVNEKFSKNFKEIIGQVILNLKSLRKINDSRLEDQNYFDSRFYKEINLEKCENNGNKLGLDIGQIIKNYDKLTFDYFDQRYSTASVNDLTPSNILVGDNLKIHLLDFELFALDNYTIDFVFLWLFLWRYPEWQKCLINDLIKSETDKEFFRVSLIRIVVSNLEWFLRLPGEENRQGHIWIKYLKAAGESYDSILQTK
jgi:hypothetical protein